MVICDGWRAGPNEALITGIVYHSNEQRTRHPHSNVNRSLKDKAEWVGESKEQKEIASIIQLIEIKNTCPQNNASSFQEHSGILVTAHTTVSWALGTTATWW